MNCNFQNAKECKGSRGVGGPTEPKCCGKAGQPYFIYNAFSHTCSGGKVSEIAQDAGNQAASAFNVEYSSDHLAVPVVVPHTSNFNFDVHHGSDTVVPYPLYQRVHP